MGILDEVKPDIGNSTRNGFFPPVEATYKVRIENCKNKPASDNSGPAFIAELEALEVKCSDWGSEDPVEVGDFRDWYRGTDGSGIQRKMAAKDLITFLCAASGFDPDKPASREAFVGKHGTGSKLLEAAGAKNALDNAVMELRTYPKKTKSGGVFTVHIWQPCEAAPAAADVPRPEGKARTAEAPAPPPPPAPAPVGPTPCPAEWQRDPSNYYAANPATGLWHVAATGELAPQG